MGFWSVNFDVNAPRGIVKQWSIAFGGQTYVIPQPFQILVEPDSTLSIFLADQQQPPVTGMSRPLLGVDSLSPVLIDAVSAFIANHPDDPEAPLAEFNLAPDV